MEELLRLLNDVEYLEGIKKKYKWNEENIQKEIDETKIKINKIKNG